MNFGMKIQRSNMNEDIERYASIVEDRLLQRSLKFVPPPPRGDPVDADELLYHADEAVRRLLRKFLAECDWLVRNMNSGIRRSK